MTARKTLTLTIMGRDYRLAVAPDEEANLRACAELVQSKMQEIFQIFYNRTLTLKNI